MGVNRDCEQPDWHEIGRANFKARAATSGVEEKLNKSRFCASLHFESRCAGRILLKPIIHHIPGTRSKTRQLFGLREH